MRKCMRSISTTEFRRNQKKYLELSERERVIVHGSKNRAYAIVPVEQMDETTFLLSNPVNAEHLKESMKEIERGEGISVKLEDLWK